LSKTAPNIKILPVADIEAQVGEIDKIIPRYQSDLAAAVDLYAVRAFVTPHEKVKLREFPVTVNPKEVVKFGTGIRIAIPEGLFGDVRPRSGLALELVTPANSPGTIDADYRGEVCVLMTNSSEKPYVVRHLDRIAQMIFNRYIRVTFNQVSEDDFQDTIRGSQGFGSTGTNGPGFGTQVYDQKLLSQDLYIMNMVLQAADLSDCVRGCPLDKNGKAVRDEYGHLVGQARRFGCVFARGLNAVSTGYNCQYPGSPRCADIGCLRDKLGIPSGQQFERCRATHAEEMAILNAVNNGISLAGTTMYVNAEPCVLCAKSIAHLDIESLVVLDGGYTTEEGLETVRNAGIQVRKIRKIDLNQYQQSITRILAEQ